MTDATNDRLEEVTSLIFSAIYRPQPCMSGRVLDRASPLQLRSCQDAARKVLKLLAASPSRQKGPPSGSGVPEGFWIAPNEPTQDMLDAYWKQTGDSHEMRERTHDRMRRYFSLMKAAAPQPPVPVAGEPVTLTYTNWRGETAARTITPTGRVLFTSNKWHPEPQWLVEAYDARSGEVRLFALSGFGHQSEFDAAEAAVKGVLKSPLQAGGDEVAEVERTLGELRSWYGDWNAACSIPPEIRGAWLRHEAAIRALKTQPQAPLVSETAAPRDGMTYSDRLRMCAAWVKDADMADTVISNLEDIADDFDDATPETAAGGPKASFQDRVAAWCREVFEGDPTDMGERMHRFTEEAMELTRALGQTREEAHQLVDYVHDQDHIGEPAQEMGGTLTTLAALAWFAELDVAACGEAELARTLTPQLIAKVREKRSKRHGRGPLPGTYAPDFVPSPHPSKTEPRQDGDREVRS